MVAKDDSVVISIYVTGLTATTTLITGGEWMVHCQKLLVEWTLPLSLSTKYHHLIEDHIIVCWRAPWVWIVWSLTEQHYKCFVSWKLHYIKKIIYNVVHMYILLCNSHLSRYTCVNRFHALDSQQQCMWAVNNTTHDIFLPICIANSYTIATYSVISLIDMTSQPEDQVVAVGQDFMVTCGVGEADNLTYRWIENGTSKFHHEQQELTVTS